MTNTYFICPQNLEVNPQTSSYDLIPIKADSPEEAIQKYKEDYYEEFLIYIGKDMKPVALPLQHHSYLGPDELNKYLTRLLGYCPQWFLYLAPTPEEAIQKYKDDYYQQFLIYIGKDMKPVALTLQDQPYTEPDELNRYLTRQLGYNPQWSLLLAPTPEEALKLYQEQANL